MNGWQHTITIVLSLVATAVCSALWIQTHFHDIDSRFLTLEAVDKAIFTQITTQGFSRSQAQHFVDDLRRSTDHKVPSIRDWDGAK